MASKGTVTFDKSKLLKKMELYERLCKKEVRQLVHNSSRICCVQLAKMTFPSNRQDGERTVESRKRGVPAVFIPVEKMRALKNTKSERPALFTASEAKQYHRRFFKDGRIRIGGQDKALIKTSALRAFVKEQQRKVGYCKAGWAAAASLCKADVRSPMRGIPAWVTRNVRMAMGRVSEIKFSGLSFFVGLTNLVPYTSKILKEHYKDIAVRNGLDRFESMLTRALKHELPKKAGFK